MKGEYNPDVLGFRVKRLMSSEPELGFAILRLHLLMVHRSLKTMDLASEAGISKYTVRLLLNGKYDGSPTAYLRNLERLEDAVTTLTDRRGYACECTPQGRAAIAHVLAHSVEGSP